MGAINPGAAIYGAVRGLQDSDQADERRKAFGTDQQIREEQLSSEREQGPLRRRVLEGELARQPQQDELTRIGLDAAKLKQGDEAMVRERAKKALGQHDALVKAYRSLQNFDDAGATAALKEFNPEGGDVAIKRGDDGSITLDGGKGQPVTFKQGAMVRTLPNGQVQETPMVLKDGTKLSAEDGLLMHLAHEVDPVKHMQGEYDYAQKANLEDKKTDRAYGVADRRAGAVANRQSEAWTGRQLNQIKPVLDSMLKTQGVSGSFISGYAHENDAELRGIIEEGVEAEVMNGAPIRKAARAVVDDVRSTYDKAANMAKEKAAALTKAKINPRDRKAIEAAAQAGNKDAKDMLNLIKATEQALGPSVAKYLLGALPAK